MFALIIIKFNYLPNRTRLLAGISAGLILAALGLLVYYRAFCYDSLSRYTSPNTVAYLHLDYRSTPENFYKLKLTDALLNSFKLEDLNRHWLSSEIAVVCDNYNQELNCGLLIETKAASELGKYLNTRQTIFKKLNSNTFIIADSDWAKTVKRSWNFFRYFKYQNTIGRFGSLTLVFNRPKILNNELSKTLYLAGNSKFIKFSGATTAQGLVLRHGGLINLIAFAKTNGSTAGWTNPNCDIFINSKSGLMTQLMAKQFKQLSGLVTTNDNLFFRQPFAACLIKAGTSGNFFLDYDFTVSAKQKITAEQEKNIEQALLALAAKIQPREKTYYLKDGTKIIELFPINHSLVIEMASGTKIIRLPNGKNLSFTVWENNWLISNNKKISPSNAGLIPDKNDYIFIKINSLPQNKFKRAFSEFSYLIANNKQLIIK